VRSRSTKNAFAAVFRITNTAAAELLQRCARQTPKLHFKPLGGEGRGKRKRKGKGVEKK